jgi:hypothetical protein
VVGLSGVEEGFLSGEIFAISRWVWPPYFFHISLRDIVNRFGGGLMTKSGTPCRYPSTAWAGNTRASSFILIGQGNWSKWCSNKHHIYLAFFPHCLGSRWGFQFSGDA